MEFLEGTGRVWGGVGSGRGGAEKVAFEGAGEEDRVPGGLEMVSLLGFAWWSLPCIAPRKPAASTHFSSLQIAWGGGRAVGTPS